MPGMLTAFRFEALRKIGGFSPDKLLEDYDVTVRIKNAGYKSAIIADAVAWTYAPENLKDLGKQRIRWSYGGLMVIKDFYRNVTAVFQDLLGHMLFLSLFILVALSFIFSKESETPAILIYGLIFVALLHFVFAYIFNVLSLKTYPERDRKDWAIKLSILPEFAYSNLLSLILIGAYFFLAFNLLTQERIKIVPGVFGVRKLGLKGFSKIGYSNAWGTRI
jgi:cellulose synthase/poly-beta-1,6-N-acetylglucosamine synthase-like glycosyltransferase